jgi:uncharacterized membrane protein YfcA
LVGGIDPVIRALIAVVALLAGGVAAVTGFGIGSLLTPVLAIETATKLAVAAVAIPHLVGTLQRFWMLRGNVDRRVLLGFAVAGISVPRTSFVATATAIGLFVDAARLPVYLATEWSGIAGIAPIVVVATAPVMIGTALGTRVLGRVPEYLFRRVIAILLTALGLYMALGAHP